MMDYNPLKLGSSRRVHIFCAIATLKVITKAIKSFNTLITSNAILPYKCPTLRQILYTSMEGLVMYELDSLCAL